jgi:anti-sigma regulatory factor (Ser/Thr protein kinase)
MASATERISASPRRSATPAVPAQLLLPEVLVGELPPGAEDVMTAMLTDGIRRRLAATGEVVSRIRRSARRHVAEVFAADPDNPTPMLEDLLDDVALVVDELVSNAVRRPISTCTVDRTVDVDVSCFLTLPGEQTGAVRICVWDDNPASVPVPPERPDPDELVPVIDDLDESGRGLLITRMCVAYLDVIRDEERGGKWVRALMLVDADTQATEAASALRPENDAADEMPAMAIVAEPESCSPEEANE